jgi:murein DD-endopeptidase MepM/ murein hydrolase activator NlpD
MPFTTSRLQLGAAFSSLLLSALVTGCFFRGESPNLTLRGTVSESSDSIALSPMFLTQQHEAESTFLNKQTVVTDEGPLPLVFDPNYPDLSNEPSEAVAAESTEPSNDIPVVTGPEVPSTVTDAVGDFDGLPIIWPVETGRLSSYFGLRKRRLHAGIDISAPRGTPVRAAAAGQILLVRRQNGYGKMIVVEHGIDHQTVYGHLDSYAVSEGDVVRAGDVIGAVGKTGRATGFHLHFETRVGQGIPRDPLSFLPSVKEIQPKVSFNPALGLFPF